MYHDCNGVVDGLFISFIDDDGCNDVDSLLMPFTHVSARVAVYRECRMM